VGGNPAQHHCADREFGLYDGQGHIDGGYKVGTDKRRDGRHQQGGGLKASAIGCFRHGVQWRMILFIGRSIFEKAVHVFFNTIFSIKIATAGKQPGIAHPAWRQSA